ncbi:MAG TPA: hypothetical protein VGC99_17405 [Candidatus Tectomicrobia bacterium]
MQAHAQALEHDLQKLMRRFGRPCRGMGNVLVTLVRQTETPWLALGAPVLPLARAAQQRLPGATALSEEQRACLDTQITTAIEAHHRIAHQSRRLTQGKALSHGKIVNAYDPTIAPMCKGKRNGPAPCGRKPGMIAEPAAGFIFGLHVPVGNPSDASDVQPLIDHVQQAIGRVSTSPRPTLHSLAGDLACNDASLREALHQQGMLTVGIPKTVAPLPSSPTPEDVLRLLGEGGLPGVRTSCQVHLASACGYSRPVVERLMASLLGRGAARIAYQGHHGAIVHMGMTVMAHNAATLVRIHEYRLSTRARTFRRRLRLRCRQVSQCNASIH